MHGVLADEALVAEHDALLAADAAAQVARPADDRAPQPHALAEVGVVVDHGALEVGVAAHPHVGAEHRVLADAGAGLDPAVVADDRRARRPRPSGWTSAPSPSHTPSPSSKPGMSTCDLAVEDVLVGPHVGLERADVLPVALGDGAVERLAVVEQLREDLAGEVDRTGPASM